ncbi:MAG: N-acetyl-gamma-glutamyl-phosphate reductase [Myxococcota bacterium]|nr:N-acetyl-gamma-glutamyl-phosphate reductase [Myxococcota bacterium]
MPDVSILGASGYTGGELARLLLDHPEVNLAQVTSRHTVGRYLHSVHPNLRGRTHLKFTDEHNLSSCDLLFSCLPHGITARMMDSLAGIADRVIDLSADFRLQDADAYDTWYGTDHPAPEWRTRFVYGLPEINRERIAKASYVSGVGCNATAMIFALLPLASRNLIQNAVVDIKAGSSEGGNSYSAASHHPERTGALRPFAPVGHRHQAEVTEQLGEFPLHVTVSAVQMVRGVSCTAHVFLSNNLDARETWRIYRDAYSSEPFVRIVKEKRGIYRFPEPKILTGSNYCDVGFEVASDSNRIVVFSAIDNLMKGAAGNAVQVMNIMFGWEERLGLEFPGLHPV